MDAPASTGDLWCIDFSTPGGLYDPIGYIGCDHGMLKSWDGTVWFDEGARSYAVYGFAFAPPMRGLAACAGGLLLVTTTSGTTWVEANTGSIPWVDFRAVELIDYSNAVAAGSFGALSQSTNSGNSWTTLFMTGFDGVFHQLHFFNPTTGVVVGDGGLIIREEDGEWNQVPSGTSVDLFGLHFPSGTVGYAVGGTGVVLKTTDAGVTWQSLASPTTNDLHAVHFENELAGYIAGAGATLWYTLDGGLTWEPDNVTTTLPEVTINALNIHDDQYYAVGNDGLILRHGVLVGIKEHEPAVARMVISPNPAKDVISLEVPGQTLERAGIAIFNAMGQSMLQAQAAVGSPRLIVDIRSLPPGLFFCKARSGNGLAIGSFVKK